MVRFLAQRVKFGFDFTKASDGMDWDHVVRNTAIAVDITFVMAVSVYLAIRFFVSVL